MGILSSPLMVAMVLGWLTAGGTYLFKEFQQGRQWKVAYEQGLKAGRGEGASATVTAAHETADAERAAEEAVPLSATKAELIERCKRSASCRERRALP